MPINTTKKLTPDKRLYKLLIVRNRPACQEWEKTIYPIIYYEVPKKSSVSLFFKMLLAVVANNFKMAHKSFSSQPRACSRLLLRFGESSRDPMESIENLWRGDCPQVPPNSYVVPPKILREVASKRGALSRWGPR